MSNFLQSGITKLLTFLGSIEFQVPRFSPRSISEIVANRYIPSQILSNAVDIIEDSNNFMKMVSSTTKQIRYFVNASKSLMQETDFQSKGF